MQPTGLAPSAPVNDPGAVPVWGRFAHAAGYHIGACPYPAGPEAQEWRCDWINAEAHARVRSGTFGAPPEQIEAMEADLAVSSGPLDPTWILDSEDPLDPEAPVRINKYQIWHPSTGLVTDHAAVAREWTRAMKQATEALSGFFIDVAKSATDAFGRMAKVLAEAGLIDVSGGKHGEPYVVTFTDKPFVKVKHCPTDGRRALPGVREGLGPPSEQGPSAVDPDCSL